MDQPAINSVLVLGGGSAGFLAAITLKLRMPMLKVTVLRSPDLGIIGVGEGTTGGVVQHLHGYLGLHPGEFLREAEPVWKLGLRFLWGPRPHFDYSFGIEIDSKYSSLSKPTGFFLDADMDDFGIYTAMMSRNKVFRRGTDGQPIIDAGSFAYHLENATFVRWLESVAARSGIEMTDGTVTQVRQNEHGITSLELNDGRSMSVDLYVDASGFRRMLVHGSLHEPFVDFAPSLWCDRAVVGGWMRRDHEPFQPYTLCETMDAGWCWRIDHERRINRGYVYCSAYLTDEQAEQEFRRKNPEVGPTRIVRFPSGRLERAWVKNVVAIGNAFGFVEPLEATSLAMICMCCRNLAEILADGDRVVSQSRQLLYNRLHTSNFDRDRWFLSLHYKFNTRIPTAFWKDCTEKVDVAGIEDIIGYYQENGPSTLFLNTFMKDDDPYGAEGYLALLIGQKVSHRRPHAATAFELKTWVDIRQRITVEADRGVGFEEAMMKLKSPQWPWKREAFSGRGVMIRPG